MQTGPTIKDISAKSVTFAKNYTFRWKISCTKGLKFFFALSLFLSVFSFFLNLHASSLNQLSSAKNRRTLSWTEPDESGDISTNLLGNKVTRVGRSVLSLSLCLSRTSN